MKICFVIGAVKYSGAENVLSSIIKGLRSKGHEISIILTRQKEPVIKEENGITRFGVYTEGRVLARKINRIKKIRRTIQLHPVDVVVSFGYVCNSYTIPALIGMKTPLVICERNDPRYDPKRQIDRIQRKLVYPFADGYVFQTRAISNYFGKTIQRKAGIIHNALTHATPECVANASRMKVVATVARLDNVQKNQIMLINGFAKLSREFPEYSLKIYGDGPDREKYEQLIAQLGMNQKIELCGFTPDPINKLREADVFVLTSNFEGMPNALIEAMALGLPCISTDCGGGGAAELISSMENGILIPVHDEQKYIEALRLLLTNEALKKQLGQKAYEINKRLDLETITSKWIEYLLKIVEGKSNAICE